MAGQKQKVPDVSDSNHNVEITCNSKPKFSEQKDSFTKRVQKTSQRWIMYAANKSILELRILSWRCHFRL